jgi:hypothetical protein
MRMLVTSTLFVAFAAGIGAPTRPAPAPVRPSLADLGFMGGCWRAASAGGAIIHEYYTPPSVNLILGVSRYTTGERVTGYEFTTIAARGDSDLVLTPRPSGQSPTDFNLTTLDSGLAVWSNPAHDFPTRITYRRAAGDSLVARIEGPGAGGTRSVEWRMGRATCGG